MYVHKKLSTITRLVLNIIDSIGQCFIFLQILRYPGYETNV